MTAREPLPPPWSSPDGPDPLSALGCLFDQARAWAATVDSDEQKQYAHESYRAILAALTTGDQP